MQNITAMRRWMKENNKDSYSVYYSDGMNYEVVEELKQYVLAADPSLRFRIFHGRCLHDLWSIGNIT